MRLALSTLRDNWDKGSRRGIKLLEALLELLGGLLESDIASDS